MKVFFNQQTAVTNSTDLARMHFRRQLLPSSSQLPGMSQISRQVLIVFVFVLSTQAC
jgi:hypothetical protein